MTVETQTGLKQSDYHRALEVPPTSVLGQFYKGVVTVADGGASNLEKAPVMLALFNLDGDEPDGMEFEARFLLGVPEELAIQIANKSNRRRRPINYNPGIRALNHILTKVKEDTATPNQIRFIRACAVSTRKQFVREGDEKFCDMGLDLALYIGNIKPAFYDDEIFVEMLLLPPPINSERHFTGLTDEKLGFKADRALRIFEAIS